MADKNTADKKPKDGDIAVVHYTGTFDDGVKFDSSEGNEPIEVEIGSGKVISGFEAGIREMSIGEEKNIKIKPIDAYGERDPKKIQAVPKNRLPKEHEPKPGMMLSLRAPDGKMFLAKIDHADEDKAYLDFNHPLAGKNLNFKLKLMEIKKK